MEQHAGLMFARYRLRQDQLKVKPNLIGFA